MVSGKKRWRKEYGRWEAALGSPGVLEKKSRISGDSGDHRDVQICYLVHHAADPMIAVLNVWEHTRRRHVDGIGEWGNERMNDREHARRRVVDGLVA